MLAIGSLLLCAGCRSGAQRDALPMAPDSAREVGLALSDRLSEVYKRDDLLFEQEMPLAGGLVTPPRAGCRTNTCG
jgi:hypothetical protein